MRRGIFQGDCLFPLILVLCTSPLTLILRKAKVGYEFKVHQQHFSHLLFMDDLKLHGRHESHVSSLVDTRMELGLKKCSVLIVKRGKIKYMDEVLIWSGEVME